ncbi:hypothetical protein GALMADRAFT_225714 [Galerina marginata CBS 339.88]|uniref:DUF6589 domain-containing protein n=1 Tax=Galerina marginata (strain CBS 339.88) TaxID=685588 RepID=A0A067TAI4_GALM3|nr:hypothetical protein GALMADRAFT_225714 [Galerina marginata CBS 339.88]
MSTEAGMTEVKRIADGPHILHIDRSVRPNGSKKLSASILTLPDANAEDMLLEPILERRRRVPEREPELNDIMPNKEQRESILQQAAVLAVHSLTKYVSEFKKYEDEPLFQFPQRRPLPKAHRTLTLPVATSLGEQFTVARFISLVKETYVTQLHLDEKSFEKRAIPCVNDTFANVSIRRAQMSPSTTDADRQLLHSLQLGPGLNDILRKMVTQTIKNYCPKGSDSTDGLAGLFKVINKAHLALAKPQDHDAALSALETIVDSSFLDCWRINCGYDSIAAYAASDPEPAEMLALAKKIVIKHAKRLIPKQPERFPDDSQYSAELSDQESDDMVYRNHRLLLRDAIYIVLLKRAISDGDFGRVEDFLGVTAVSLMGGGMENSCFEIIHFLHDLKDVWPEQFGNIMRDSMIVNYFKQGSNAMPADMSLSNLASYSKFFYEGHGWEDEWHSPKTMAEAIELVDRLDEKVTLKNITEQMAGDRECCVM